MDILFILRNNMVNNTFHDVVMGDQTKSLISYNSKNVLSYGNPDEEEVLDEWYMEE